MKSLLAILVFVILAMILVSCNNDAEDRKNAKAGVKNSVAVDSDNKVIDYGNGVYYFCYSQDYFAKALSRFINNHPGLELVSMASDVRGVPTTTSGYFVVFRQKTAVDSTKIISK